MSQPTRRPGVRASSAWVLSTNFVDTVSPNKVPVVVVLFFVLRKSEKMNMQQKTSENL